MKNYTIIKLYINLIFTFILIINTICIGVSFHTHTESTSICIEQIDYDDYCDVSTSELIYTNQIHNEKSNQCFTYKPLISKYIKTNIFQPPKY